MSNIANIINRYFIEMVSNEESKTILENRLHLSQMERDELPMPITKTISDAFYVVLGCAFQDNPIRTILILFAFVIVVGIYIANVILHLFS